MAMMNAGYSSTPWTDSIKANLEARREKGWRDMLQAAALANKMNDRTAIGFGLGALLANNWDKWFGGGKGSSSNNNANGNNGQYDFSLSMATTKDPLQFAAAGGDPHAKFALEQNKPFSLADVPQNTAITTRPLPDNLTVNGVNPQAPAEITYQAGIPFTQQTINGQAVTDPNKAMMDSNMNPANFANFAKSVGASTSPWSNAQNHQLADTDWLNWLNKKYPWEVQ